MIINKFQLFDEELNQEYSFELTQNKASVSDGKKEYDIPIFIYNLIKRLYDDKELILNRAFNMKNIIENYLNKDFLDGINSITDKK